MNKIISHETSFTDLGTIDYQEAWDYQTGLFNAILKTKTENRIREGDEKATANHLLFCEHPHVFTLGKSGDETHLLVPKEDLHTIGASYYHINRGGDITYHGPGQIVVYPVVDLENFFTDIHRYMRMLEESVILTLRKFGVNGERIPGLTGVWIDAGGESPRKICALGVKTSRWVTMHGLAFNVTTDLAYFRHIVPCGIEDKSVTSLHHELGRAVDITAVKALLKENLATLFEMKLLKEPASA